MMNVPSFREELISQIPALQLLMNLGFTYLQPDEALKARGGKFSNVILESILLDQLPKINAIRYKGQVYQFSKENLQEALRKLKNEPYDGLVRTSDKIYDRLTLGADLPQTIEGNTRSYNLRYIDWKHPENNVYHVSDEFVVERRRSKETRRPDIVVFVNGIPLVVIECKRPDLNKGGDNPVTEAVTQMIRNQKDDQIPGLFIYSQLLMAVSKNAARYGTTGTPKKFWSIWEEEGYREADLHKLVNKSLSRAKKDLLYNHREYARNIRNYFNQLELEGDRLSSEQDKALYHLLQPKRLLELSYQFIVYDTGIKKIARYQQYFAVKKTIERVESLNVQGKRTGGVIWHTTGSGKSLTMVMLAKALALHPTITKPRIILVTDRIDLDDQIWNTFVACGKKVHKAQSGADLVEKVKEGKFDIITTIINKFEAADNKKFKDENPNIFVLVDESHRSQYGSFNAKMRRIFPNACYIGFTGTPLLKAEKSTVAKFGDFIHKYPMQKAVSDQAVVPLLYEGRMADLGVNQEQIDKWFERVTRNLNEDQKRDLKNKFSRTEAVSRTEQRIQQIAYDITEHYTSNFQGTGFKAQLAVDSKEMALLYKRFLDDFGEVSSEVIISPPDTREGNEQVDNTKSPEMEAFWKRMMERFGSEDKYISEIKASFARPDGCEILIVVDKLLTGFDEPRNTVLYIDKPLKEHSLLQAIARVNRLFEGKDFGYIIDYRGVLGELNMALNTYNALAAYDTEDVAGILPQASEEVKKLPLYHAALWDVFKEVKNKKDTEALERFLEPEDRRQEFYEALTAFANCLKIALSTSYFYQNTPEDQINRYKEDLRFFHNLRISTRQRYAETIDYKDYEQRVRKLMNQHVTSSEVKPITELVNIFDGEAFASEVEKVKGTAAKADIIAYRVKKTVTTRLAENPQVYQRFSDLINKTIEDYKAGRLNEAEYLKRASEVLEQVQQGKTSSMPEKLRRYRDAAAYYGVLESILELREQKINELISEEALADIAIGIEERLEKHKIRDWVNNNDVKNGMKTDIEDYLYDIESHYGLALTGIEKDLIMEQAVEVAKQRDRL
ncbi:type I restriction endonuclease subunit R [Ktedonospora formicarum]|uniref:Type I restriction enzyme endonuclease subunit n=1 Tax=Ktedonospora formicarum TaxID=2778364 RepID=A0A8J3I5T4_9CHLR|nr:HsdR family type I site-specific deoxyribonuclease [Ktedonospora formicarum]GHO49176.1 DEAD/DEAH box helicase [Ktedonospora formicarum]